MDVQRVQKRNGRSKAGYKDLGQFVFFRQKKRLIFPPETSAASVTPTSAKIDLIKMTEYDKEVLSKAERIKKACR